MADLDRVFWIRNNLRIITKDGRLTQLNPNVCQMSQHNSVQLQRERGLPVRELLLKARQWGGTTWITAEGFYEIDHNSNWNAMAVSVDADSTDHIFRIIRLYHDELPRGIRKATDNTNRKEIIYSRPHRSRFLSQTAGKTSLGRSFTCQYLHCSEVAFWENAELLMSGLEQIVPYKPGTTIIQETTANMQGGYFYNIFSDAVDRRKRYPDDYAGWMPVFMPWYKFPEYAVDPPAGFGFSKEERSIQKRFDLTEAQLYWRRLKLDSLNGDVSLLAREYPATWREAFQQSGNPVFPAELIAYQDSTVKEAKRYLFDETSGVPAPELTDELTNCWFILQMPKEDHDYAVGIDTKEGRLSDVNNPKSKTDRDGVAILDRNTGEYVAIYIGQSDQKELAVQALRACVFYNEAYVAPEIPQSMILLNYFREHGYPNVYNRQRHEDHETETESEVLGWRTTGITRKWLVDDFIVACKDSVRVCFQQVVDEMRTFVRTGNGRPDHLPGEHDDLLFAAMIAYQAHKRCPMGQRALKITHTGGPSPEHEDSDNDLARVGAVDDWVPGEDDDEEEEEHTD